MKHLQEFRNPDLAKNIIRQIETEACSAVKYRLMEFCGGHTHAIFRYGIPDLLPDNIQLIHGPGCPVCVLPTSRIDAAIDLLRKHNVTLCTYADLLRVPTSDKNSLLKEKARGADIRPVYS
ncbi:MAG: hydrogenase formation protein HypD, partial [Gammaproteobacteria bacterium]|nr:hydrogenase formation protein HypD [Gammaproteobacteria bacterium]